MAVAVTFTGALKPTAVNTPITVRRSMSVKAAASPLPFPGRPTGTTTKGCSSSSSIPTRTTATKEGLGSLVGTSTSSAMVTLLGGANQAMALVDERMSTEGTGLSLGLSNNLLGWILLGVFALIWSLYTVYTSDLDEDEDSGLSL